MVDESWDLSAKPHPALETILVWRGGSRQTNERGLSSAWCVPTGDARGNPGRGWRWWWPEVGEPSPLVLPAQTPRCLLLSHLWLS